MFWQFEVVDDDEVVEAEVDDELLQNVLHIVPPVIVIQSLLVLVERETLVLYDIVVVDDEQLFSEVYKQVDDDDELDDHIEADVQLTELIDDEDEWLVVLLVCITVYSQKQAVMIIMLETLECSEAGTVDTLLSDDDEVGLVELLIQNVLDAEYVAGINLDKLFG